MNDDKSHSCDANNVDGISTTDDYQIDILQKKVVKTVIYIGVMHVYKVTSSIIAAVPRMFMLLCLTNEINTGTGILFSSP